jgi:hypothetical protein
MDHSIIVDQAAKKVTIAGPGGNLTATLKVGRSASYVDLVSAESK